MARPLRLDYPDSFYHVLSRGNERRDIFRERADYLKFLDLLEEMTDRFKVEIHAYVLMSNHFHLLIKTNQSNLSRAIQWVGLSYAGWFNRKHKRTGHLFQGRFKSFLIENDRYFTAMSFYIHGNPLRAGIVKNLFSYEWSSYRGYADRKNQVPWLTSDVILSRHGGNRKRFIKEQSAYLKKADNLLTDLRHGLYLGSEEFAAECVKRIRGEDRREKPQVKSLLKGRDIKTLTYQIVKQLGEKKPEIVLKSKRRERRPLRDITIYLVNHLGLYTNREIGEVFGVGYTSVTEAVKRGAVYLQESEKLQKIAHKIIIDN
jgi:REP element-mobilizing transposase RayT